MLGILLFAAPAFFLLQQLRTAPQARITFNIQAYDGHGRYDYDDEDARVKQKHHLAHERQQPLVVPTHTKVLFSADTPPSQAHWYGASAFHHGLVGSIEKTGHYRVRCAYRCGIEHMPYPIEVEAKTEKAYLTWHKTHATLI